MVSAPNTYCLSPMGPSCVIHSALGNGLQSLTYFIGNTSLGLKYRCMILPRISRLLLLCKSLDKLWKFLWMWSFADTGVWASGKIGYTQGLQRVCHQVWSGILPSWRRSQGAVEILSDPLSCQLPMHFSLAWKNLIWRQLAFHKAFLHPRFGL